MLFWIIEVHLCVIREKMYILQIIVTWNIAPAFPFLWKSSYFKVKAENFNWIFCCFHFPFSSVQFSHSSCPTLCDHMDCSMPGIPVNHQLTVYSNSCPLNSWCHPTMSSSVTLFSSCLQSFSALGCFPVSRFFASVCQNIGVSVSPILIFKAS